MEAHLRCRWRLARVKNVLDGGRFLGGGSDNEDTDDEANLEVEGGSDHTSDAENPTSGEEEEIDYEEEIRQEQRSSLLDILVGTEHIGVQELLHG